MKDSRQRLFEMMNRVSGMPLIKENNGFFNLPPGFNSNDFMPLEDYVIKYPCNSDVNEENFKKTNPNEFGANLKPVDDIQALLRKKEDEINKKKHDYETGGRIHNKTIEDIKTAEGDFDIVKLKEILEYVPTENQLLGQNSKMKKTNFYNITLPELKGLIYKQTDEKFYVVVVCPHAGICTKDCYAQMGYYIINDVTVRLNAQKLNYLINNWDEWKSRMISRIKSIGNYNGIVVRWHDSGDFLSQKYLEIAYDIANKTQFANHYTYTKEVSMVLGSKIPRNFEIKFSYGGKDDNLINPNIHGHARVIPEELFKDLKPKDTGEGWNFNENSIELLKDRIAEKYHEFYNLDINSFKNLLLTNDQLIQIRYSKKNKQERKWIVINWSGMNDIPALRRDVLAVFNLWHK